MKSRLGFLVLAIVGAGYFWSQHQDAHLSAPKPIQGRLASLSFDQQRGDLRELVQILKAKVTRDETGDGEFGAEEGLALLHLVAGEPRIAIEGLQRLLEESPRNSRLLSHLAAARIELGRRQDRPYQFLLAASAAARSLALDRGLASARFNYALALTRLSLKEQASLSWSEFLVLEEEPEWKEEASRWRETTIIEKSPSSEQLIQALDPGESDLALEELARKAPAFFREHVEQSLLPAWGRALIAGAEDEGSRILAASKRVAKTLAVTGGAPVDRTLERLELLSLEGGGRQEAAQALVLYGKGLELATNESWSSSRNGFEGSERALKAHLPEFSGWISFKIAETHYHQFEYELARARLSALLTTEQHQRSPALLGRAASLLGVIHGIEGDPEAAIRFYERALGHFQSIGENKYIIKQLTLLAESQGTLGRAEKAWESLALAFKVPVVPRAPETRLLTWATAALLSLSEDAPELALVFQQIYLSTAQKSGRVLAVIDALRGRAGILNVLGRHQEAAADLERASSLLEQKEGEISLGLAGDVAMVEAQMAGNNDSLALSHWHRAVEAFRSTSYDYRLSLSLHQRGRRLVSLGEIDRAQKDYLSAIEESERQRLTISHPLDRIFFFDQVRALYDDMIELQWGNLENGEAAFHFGERARSRQLLDWIKKLPGAEMEVVPSEILGAGATFSLEALPPRVQVIAYRVLEHKTLAFFLRAGDRPIGIEIGMGAREIATQVAGLREALWQNDRGRVEDFSSVLGKRLLSPFLEDLDKDHRLVLVLDRALHRLPFALLRIQPDRYLTEDFTISVSPSLSVFQEQQKAARKISPESRALVVTSPAFDSQTHALPELRYGKLEAGFASFYPGSKVLTGRAATRRTLLEWTDRFEILYFGGHSVANPVQPLLSHLVLAPETDNPGGFLYSKDILLERYRRCQLVILASCNSGTGRIFENEGAQSLARSYLAAGASQVIASLWPVSDDETAAFFKVFFSHLAATQDPALALRLSQVDFLVQSTASTWPAFVLIGA